MDPDYQVGDLVEFVGSSQLYFHFPTDEWYNVQEGDIGIVIKTALNNLVWHIELDCSDIQKVVAGFMKTS